MDSTVGSVLLCMLDCYSGYHQIVLHPDDEDKTTFITPHGIYFYKVMTFGLENAGATYQKAYIYDVVVKTTWKISSLPTSLKPSPTYENFSGSSTQPSVSSVCLLDCSWASWSGTEALKPTLRRSTLYARWLSHPTRNIS
jgi:hypothetical protein